MADDEPDLTAQQGAALLDAAADFVERDYAATSKWLRALAEDYRKAGESGAT
jgi:hypothetical protein